jgi:hypothetical protein
VSSHHRFKRRVRRFPTGPNRADADRKLGCVSALEPGVEL